MAAGFGRVMIFHDSFFLWAPVGRRILGIYAVFVADTAGRHLWSGYVANPQTGQMDHAAWLVPGLIHSKRDIIPAL